jgi:transposase InsO family protein
MPWRETSPMEQRLEFVHEYESGLFTMTELAAQYGISRRTGYKWLERHAAEGAAGLFDRSRRPQTSPNATDPALIDALVALRRRHPRWGARKLLRIARGRDPRGAWPARSTVYDALNARGLVAARRRRPHYPPGAFPLAPITRPNEVWTTDFKGEFRTGDGAYCYPLTLRDGFSRFVLRCDALVSPTYEATRHRFERAFAEYGLPDRIRSDNGPPFASTGLAGLSRLAVWWIRLGIRPERIAAGHPEQNGSHEQFHAVLKADTTRPPASDASAQQRRFTRFCAEYNHERPHEALHDAVPATRYHPSSRALPARVPVPEYPGHCAIRRVSPIGQISWNGQLLFVSGALAGEDIAFEEVDDGLWTVYFAHLILGRLDERQRQIHPIAPVKVGGGPPHPGDPPGPKKKKKKKKNPQKQI